MEKDLGRIKKNDDTDIIIRIDDFGGSSGLTIREFVTSDKYKGFTKAGVRIKADKFEEFKKMINSINPADLATTTTTKPAFTEKNFSQKKSFGDEESGLDEDGLM